MTDREISLRSIIFLVIGILLLLSLVICIYIVDGEKDLVKISAEVVNVNKDTAGTGKNDVTVSYRVNNVFYEYNFYYKDDVNVNDKIDIYYHENNAVAVQTFKTSKLIFVCPIVGLLLCIFGLFELFKKSKDEIEEEFKTQVISEDGNTQQLKIITDNAESSDYVKSAEELQEEPVKKIEKKTNPFLEDEIKVESAKKEHEDNTIDNMVQDTDIVENVFDEEEEVDIFSEINEEYSFMDDHKDDEMLDDSENFIDMSTIVEEDAEEIEFDKGLLEVDTLIKEEKIDIDSVLRKAREENVSLNNKTKKVEEKNEEPKKSEKRVDKKNIKVSSLKKVLPKYYYVVGDTLVYELVGQEAKEISFEDVVKVVKTINSEDKLVKVCVMSDEVNCVLTNMSNVDLNNVCNMIHNRMLTIDEGFNEEIEHKEY